MKDKIKRVGNFLESYLSIPSSAVTFPILNAQSEEPFRKLAIFMFQIKEAIEKTDTPASADAGKQGKIVDEKIEELFRIFKKEDMLNGNHKNITRLWGDILEGVENLRPFINTLPEHTKIITLNNSLSDFENTLKEKLNITPGDRLGRGRN